MRLGECGIPRPKPDRTESQKGRFAEALRKQFRAVMKALTRPTPEPELKPRRRREETEQGFSAARSMFRRVVRVLPFPALNPAWEPFTWLRLWDYSETVNLDEWVAPETHGSDLFPQP